MPALNSRGFSGTVSRQRRRLLRSLATVAAGTALWPGVGSSQPGVLTRPVPSTGEAVPVIGLGSWITFNVGNDRRCTGRLRSRHARVSSRPAGA